MMHFVAENQIRLALKMFRHNPIQLARVRVSGMVAPGGAAA
jgi:hypothetical protein